jgi:hypothetical protein
VRFPRPTKEELRRGHDPFLQYPFQVIIYLSYYDTRLYSLDREQIPSSLFLPTLFSLQIPIFHHIIPFLVSMVPTSTHLSSQLFIKLLYFASEFLCLCLSSGPPYFASLYQLIFSLFLSRLPIVISSVLPNIPYAQPFQLLFNSPHPFVPPFFPFLFQCVP